MVASVNTTYDGTLTPAHQQIIAAYRDRWAAEAAPAAPADRPAATVAIRRLYDAGALPEPRLIIWMDSPPGCMYAAAVIEHLGGQVRYQHGDLVANHQLERLLGDWFWDQLWLHLRRHLWKQANGRLEAHLGGRLADRLLREVLAELPEHLLGRIDHRVWGGIDALGYETGDQAWAQLCEQAWGQIGDQVGSRLSSQLRGQFDEQPRNMLSGQRSNWIGLQTDMSEFARYGCALAIAGLPADSCLDALGSVSTLTGWLTPMRGVVIAGARPAVLHHDAGGALHDPSGMAVVYPDGWGAYAWHGRRVPGWVITAPSVAAIIAEQNVEIRRCAIESMGWDRFAAEAGLAPVTAGVPDPGNPGQDLVLYDVPERLWGGRIRLLLCTNGTAERDGTRRRYGLTVPADISDPVQAAAWTAGLEKNEYARMVRRT